MSKRWSPTAPGLSDIAWQAGQLFLRHELLKVRDVQRNGETLELLKWMTEADLDKEFGGRRGRLGRALPGDRGE